MTEKKLKILMVDDDKAVLSATAAGLETDGFMVSTALNGKKGLEKIRAEQPDLILLDLILPDINGYEICKLVRKDPKTATIPIIVITGDKTVDIDKAFAAGADDCVIKPVDLGFLAGRILKIVRKQSKILIVDDDRGIVDMLSKIISKQQYEVQTMYSGAGVMELLSKEKPDLILLDISMPAGPDGIELCRLIKSCGATKDIPVVMMTANEYFDSVEKCFGYGAEDYIFKPFNIQDLMLKIAKYLRYNNRPE